MRCLFVCLFVFGTTAPSGQASSLIRFLDHTQRSTTVGRTPLGEWSARRRDLFLTTHNNHNRQTSTPPMGFEPIISAGARRQTYALDLAVTGTGIALTVDSPKSHILYTHKLDRPERAEGILNIKCFDELSSGYLPGVWVVKTDASEHCIGSIFNSTCWRLNRYSVPKRRF